MSFLRSGIAVALRCLGDDFSDNGSHRFLTGSPGTVSLTGDRISLGTQWLVHEISPNVFAFECEGVGGFLDGATIACEVKLSPNTNAPFIGTLWNVMDLPDLGTHIKLQCRGNLGSCHDGFLDGQTANGIVGLRPVDTDFSGTHWELLVWTSNPDEGGGSEDDGRLPR